MKIDEEFKALIPPLSEDEYAQLEDSILKYGCRDALVLWDNILVDGHNRYSICTKHKLPFKTVSLDLKSRQEVLIWIIQNQFARRNLTPYQRSLLALRLEDFYRMKGKANQRTSTGGKTPQLLQKSEKAAPLNTQQEIGKVAGVSHDTISKVKVIEKQATEKLKSKLLAGEMSINEAYRFLQADGIVQRRIAKRAELEKVESPAFPNKKYRCIILDPPWDMRIIPDDGRHSLRGGFEYPSMPIDEIEALPIPDLANKNGCHVFLWVTHSKLHDGLKLFEKWGVKYSCLLTWIKPKGYTPYSFMYNTEHCLFGRIGKLEVFKPGIKLSFEASSKRHSAKPDIFYDIVKQVSPSPRLEMFAREKREGFDAWGNEIK